MGTNGSALRKRPLLWLTCAALILAALSLLAPSTPTYDPWAWIAWGREITQFDLDTRTGPSWKPFPVLFTTPFAFAGDAAPELWLVIARAGALLAVAFAYRLAARLGGALAGVLAAVGLVLSSGWVRNAWVGNSEALLVALLLLAIERHLEGRRDQALALGLGAALLRPEVWPFLGLYGLWLWFSDPGLRRWLAAGALAVPALWFGPELWGSGDPLRASSRAQEGIAADRPALAESPALEIVRDGVELLLAPIAIGFLVAIAIAAAFLVRVRRPDSPGRLLVAGVAQSRVSIARGDAICVLALAAGALAWLALVAVMTEAGYAGNQRYLVPAGAIACVVGGVGLAWLARAAGAWRGSGLQAAATVAILLACSPFFYARGRDVVELRRALAYEAHLNGELDDAIERAGGRARVLACGQPFTGPYQVPVLAWQLGLHGRQVGFQPRAPAIVFSARPTRTQRPAPALPRDGRGLERVAKTERWRVLAACKPGAGLR